MEQCIYNGNQNTASYKIFVLELFRFIINSCFNRWVKCIFKSPHDNFIKQIVSGLKHFQWTNMFKPDTL